MKKHSVVPGARRMVSSLRGVGYSLETAIADLVDNSIEAGATEIDIDWHQGNNDGPANWVRISDNGLSMGGARATEALRYGSEVDEEERGPKLSAFGFGLKTASTSQCRKVYLAAKQKGGKRSTVRIRLLDLDYIDETNEWTIRELTASEAPQTLLAPLADVDQGTVVLWQELDRILNYVDPYTARSREAIKAKFDAVGAHLGTVFHRYISGTTRAKTKKIVIRLNGRIVEPWDPFCLDEPATDSFEQAQLNCPGKSPKGFVPVYVTGYILPHLSEFSSEVAHKRAAGIKTWNRSQGYYFYRSDRIIQFGGWAGTKGLDPHGGLARIAIEFDPRADDAFEVDIAKGKVRIPLGISSSVKEYTAPVTRAANKAYRKGETAGRPGPSSGGGSGSAGGAGGSGSGGDPGTGGGSGSWTYSPEATEALRKAGSDLADVAKRINKKSALNQILKKLAEVNEEAAKLLGHGSRR